MEATRCTGSHLQFGGVATDKVLAWPFLPDRILSSGKPVAHIPEMIVNIMALALARGCNKPILFLQKGGKFGEFGNVFLPFL